MSAHGEPAAGERYTAIDGHRYFRRDTPLHLAECKCWRVRDTKRCIVHDENYTTVCRGCRADAIARDEESA